MPDYNWDEVLAKNEELLKAYQLNEYHFDDWYYKNVLKVIQESFKDSASTSHTDSPEYEDFVVFTDCKGIRREVLVITFPVNGPWYDYIGIDASATKCPTKSMKLLGSWREAGRFNAHMIRSLLYMDATHPDGRGGLS